MNVPTISEVEKSVYSLPLSEDLDRRKLQPVLLKLGLDTLL
jgi:hypothetical protein